MINKLYKLRPYIPDEYIDLNPYGLVVEEREEKVIVMDFVSLKDDNSNSEKAVPDYLFQGCYLETYTREKNETKFFFKKVIGRGTSEFPTVFITYNDLTETYFSLEKKRGKLIQILQKYKDNKFLNALQSSLIQDNLKFRDSVAETMRSRENDNQLFILTIRIDGQYIGECELFQDIRNEAKKNNFSDYYSLTKSKQIKARNKICSVCLKNELEVWGYVSTFNFYTAKTEFAPISGGFNLAESWKNYPVCPDCAMALDETKYVLENNMRYNFCGFSYYLVPEFLNSHEDNFQIMELFLDKEAALGKFTMNEQDRDAITYYEDEILEYLQESDNRVNYTLFFYEKNNREFKILLSVEDVYPSQFKIVFNAKKAAENHSIFKELENAKDTLKFKFELLKEFLPLSQEKSLGNSQIFQKHFLEIVRSVFLQKKISAQFILGLMVQSFQKRFSNGELYPLSLLKALLTLKFFIKLNIIDMSSHYKEKEVYVDKVYQVFFDEHEEFFDNNAKKAVFLEGVLCQKLLNIQYRERNATPFRNRLNGLKMNPKIIQRLLPETIEKLSQYKTRYRSLEEAVSTLLLDANLDNLSNDEIGFYFVMGMNLQKEFVKKEDSER